MTAATALPDSARSALETVLGLLGSERASVTSVRDPAHAWRVHVLDSLSALEVDDLARADRIADIGSGAGFPGLALAAALPEARVTLVESVRRKCEFMGRAIEAAGIANAEVACGRSEDLASGAGRESFGVVTARAVGRLATLAELASPLLAGGGVLIAWKGRRDEDEEDELARAVPALGVEPERIIAATPYAGSRNRHLHILRKTGPTPGGLPRRAGLAKKRPLGGNGGGRG